MSGRLVVLVVLLVAAVAGCKRGNGAADGGLRDGACLPPDGAELWCGSFQEEGFPCHTLSGPCASAPCSCQCGGQCLPGCPGNPTGVPCGSWSNPRPECCGDGFVCCDLTNDGHEYQTCYPLADACPTVCGPAPGVYWLCPRDSWCMLPNADPATAPPEGICVYSWPPDASLPTPECASDCPVERRCWGSFCCGAHTRCALTDGGQACCVADWPEPWGDAGVDAGAD